MAKKLSENDAFAGSLALRKSFGGGVYGIINPSNGKIYIGSTKLFCVRLRSHLHDLRKAKSRSKRLQLEFDSGATFEFVIIESIDDKNERLDREQFWINFYQSHRPEFGYNVCSNSRNSTGVKRSQETLQKLHETHIGKPQPWLRKPVSKLDRLGNELERFDSITEASKAMGFNRPNGNIITAIGGVRQKTAYGFKWRYA